MIALDFTCRCEAAIVTPTGEDGLSQPSVRVERTMVAKDTLFLAVAENHPTASSRRMA
jgi:hypothetical protein